MIGLGKMGANMVRRLIRAGHGCVVWDRSADAIKSLTEHGAIDAASVEDLVKKLPDPKAVWIMVPAGDATESTVNILADLLPAGATIVDGGNSNFRDDVRRAQALEAKGIFYVDAGTSGGVWGIDRGYCLMIGGDDGAVKRLDPIFAALAPGEAGVEPTPGRKPGQSTAEKGYLHCGPAGAGHFVKMVHNGIEYGIMQAYAEGLDILRGVNTPDVPPERRYQLPLPDIAEVWRRGSVIGSWLLDLTAMALAENPTLSNYTGFVHDSGEGRWTIQAALEEAVPAEVLTAALYTRFRSRQDHTFAEKVLSAMRQKFGGHVEQSGGGAKS
jgi:6-phosphogluconate dehydrogenase